MNPTVEAWIVIEKLGALCATPGISADVQKVANEQIEKLLKDVVSPGLAKLTASASGIITK
jgi:hypothetical protein